MFLFLDAFGGLRTSSDFVFVIFVFLRFLDVFGGLRRFLVVLFFGDFLMPSKVFGCLRRFLRFLSFLETIECFGCFFKFLDALEVDFVCWMLWRCLKNFGCFGGV